MIDLPVLQGCYTLQLTQGQNTLIDAIDYPALSAKKWHAIRNNPKGEPLRFYARRTVYGSGSSHSVQLHYAVLTISCGPRPDGMQGLHRNDDALDNRRGNLYWGWPVDNSRDARRNGRNRWVMGEKVHTARLRDADVVQIRARLAAGETRNGLARGYGVSPSTILDIAAGKSWRHIHGGGPIPAPGRYVGANAKSAEYRATDS
jgi:hypothetical protein